MEGLHCLQIQTSTGGLGRGPPSPDKGRTTVVLKNRLFNFSPVQSYEVKASSDTCDMTADIGHCGRLSRRETVMRRIRS